MNMATNIYIVTPTNTHTRAKSIRTNMSMSIHMSTLTATRTNMSTWEEPKSTHTNTQGPTAPMNMAI